MATEVACMWLAGSVGTKGCEGGVAGRSTVLGNGGKGRHWLFSTSCFVL
jgi:hypothetical protein